MDIMLAHLLIKLTTLFVLSLTLWLLPVLFLTESLKDYCITVLQYSDSFIFAIFFVAKSFKDIVGLWLYN